MAWRTYSVEIESDAHLGGDPKYFRIGLEVEAQDGEVTRLEILEMVMLDGADQDPNGWRDIRELDATPHWRDLVESSVRRQAEDEAWEIQAEDERTAAEDEADLQVHLALEEKRLA